MATTEPQARLRARNAAPGFLKNAAAKATNVASLMPRSRINAIMPLSYLAIMAILRTAKYATANDVKGRFC